MRAVDQTTLPGLEPDLAAGEEPLPLRRRSLTVHDIDRWATVQRSWIAGRNSPSGGAELEVYLQAAKLVEEVGELHSQLLGRSGRQRPEKADQFGRLELESELADVVLSTAVLASILGVDLRSAVANKMSVVERRSRPADAAP